MPVDSLCNSCDHKRNTWSKELKSQGHIGCNILQSEELRDIALIDADIVATGWINVDGHCFNDMVITKKTVHCPYHRLKTTY